MYTGSYYQYRRTVNGGQDWQGGLVAVGETSIQGGFAIQPSVYRSSRLYMTYSAPSVGESFAFDLLFLAGRDGTLGEDTVNFWEIKDSSNDPIRITPNKSLQLGYDTALPGAFSGRFTAQIAIDPTDNDRFYVVYHDTTCEDGINLDVFIHVLEFNGTYWTVSPRKRVNPQTNESCDDEPHTDQFLPAVTVDSDGEIHVVYYDDAAHDQDDSSTSVKFDVVLARSCDLSEEWEYQTFGSTTSPFLNFSLGYDSPREYLAIGFREDSEGDIRVAAAAPGTDSQDCTPNRSVMYFVGE